LGTFLLVAFVEFKNVPNSTTSPGFEGAAKVRGRAFFEESV